MFRLMHNIRMLPKSEQSLLGFQTIQLKNMIYTVKS